MQDSIKDSPAILPKKPSGDRGPEDLKSLTNRVGINELSSESEDFESCNITNLSLLESVRDIQPQNTAPLYTLIQE
jgi:hypothetical protein